jgi:hypothetical protein
MFKNLTDHTINVNGHARDAGEMFPCEETAELRVLVFNQYLKVVK